MKVVRKTCAERRKWILSCQRSQRMHQGSVLSPFLFAAVVDVVTELVRDGVLSEFLYVDDLVLISETIVGFRNTFLKWNEAFGRKSLS